MKVAKVDRVGRNMMRIFVLMNEMKLENIENNEHMSIFILGFMLVCLYKSVCLASV